MVNFPIYLKAFILSGQVIQKKLDFNFGYEFLTGMVSPRKQKGFFKLTRVDLFTGKHFQK